jgi:hypothetical protein
MVILGWKKVQVGNHISNAFTNFGGRLTNDYMKQS